MSAYSVRKPITVLMGILILIVLGIFSVTRLPLTLFPEVNLPFVVTITPYTGASPEEVEFEISRRIESAVATIGNFQEVNSISNENFAVSIISFSESTNMDSVVVELREILNNLNFSDGVGNTSILRISPDMLPVMVVTLFRSYDEQLTDDEALIRNTEWINREILTDLQSIPGIADVSISGAADIVLQVNLDEDKLSTYNLTHQQVLNTIDRQNITGLAGVVLDNGEIRLLYLGNKLDLLDDLSQLPIKFHNGSIVRLNDLIIDDGINYINANTEVYSKINGQQGIQVSFRKQSDVAITEATRNIVNRLNRIVDDSEIDASYTILLDQGEFINQSINSVLQNLLIGGLFAIIILFIFLKDIKPTIIVGLAIPISVITSFMLMYFTNISLNLVSMGGLALGIGMLVDNAVVVIENIFRMINEGKSKIEASIEGAKQVAGAITASTLTTIAVFLPIVFIEGLVAEIFISMALTIAYSLSASLLIALTLVPSMSSRFLNDQNNKKESKFLKTLQNWYKTSVLFTLRNKFLTMFLVFALLAGSLFLATAKGFILLPDSDEGVIDVRIGFSTQVPFSARAELADRVSNFVISLDDTETVSTTIGGGGGPFGGMALMSSGANNVRMTINLNSNRKMSTAENAELIEIFLDNFNYDLIDGLTKADVLEPVISTQANMGPVFGAQGIQIKVSGYDLLTLEAIANDLVDILDDVEGVINPRNGINQGSDNVRIVVNRDVAIQYGLTNQDVFDNVSYLFANLQSLGQVQSTTVTIEGIDYRLDLPQEAFAGGIDFGLFGGFENFLGGVLLFDTEMRNLIERYMENTGQSIYVPNIILPTYVPGTPIRLIVNPFLKVIHNDQNEPVEIVLNPLSPDPSLPMLAVAPLSSSQSDQSVTSINRVTGFAAINTDGTNRYLNVTAQIEEGYNVTIVSQEAVRLINEYLESNDFTQFGSGYTVEFQGENEEIMQAVFDLSIAALVAILLVYMIMAIQFQSLLYPFIILGTIPLAFTGGLLALLITGSFISLVSLMGFIILIGIVVNNGIVMIDYINKLREQGKDIVDAIVEAGQTRLRPIFMTALTTILALFALALGFGEGAELLQPMAITAIGGLIYATVLTLVVVPTVYAIMNRRKIVEEAKKRVYNER
jgi:multidrug efflux pump subunit AcrB